MWTRARGGEVHSHTSESSPRAGKDRYLCSSTFSMSLIIFSMSRNREENDAGRILEGEKKSFHGTRSTRWWSRALCRWTGIFRLLNPRHRDWALPRVLGQILEIVDIPSLSLFRENKPSFNWCVGSLYSFCVWRFYAVPEVSDEITNKINLACERFPEWNGVSLLLNNNLHCRRKQFRNQRLKHIILLIYNCCIIAYYYLINDTSHLPIDLIPNQKKKKKSRKKQTIKWKYL